MLKGKQKKLDVNKDGKISGEDFAMLKNVRMQKKDAMGKKVVKAQTGKMLTEASAPDLGRAMAASEALERKFLESPDSFLESPDSFTEIDTAMAERAARRKPLPALEEYKRKPITPKERRERDITKRATADLYKDKPIKTLKRMGGGMMQDSMGYKKGGAVRGGRAEIKGLRPAKMF